MIVKVDVCRVDGTEKGKRRVIGRPREEETKGIRFKDRTGIGSVTNRLIDN